MRLRLRPTLTRSERNRSQLKSVVPVRMATEPTSDPGAEEQAEAGETGLVARAVAGSSVTEAEEASACVAVEEIPDPRDAARLRRLNWRG